MAASPVAARLTARDVRALWIGAQRLDGPAPFGTGPAATQAAIEQLGYVQIDTINVIERCHHHILWTRIPDYRRADLTAVQSVQRTAFEYWTHALAYVPLSAYRFHRPAMQAHRADPGPWFAGVDPKDLRRLIARIRAEGPLSIRDVDDDVLVEKDHPWASRKPSKRALQLAFFRGELAIAARSGMVKTYEIAERHFGWERPPRPASPAQVAEHLLDRALRAQGVVSVESICHLDAPMKPAVRALIEARLARRRLTAVTIEEAPKVAHFAEPAVLDRPAAAPDPATVHLLSPFDPLVIQRKRLKMLFGYAHLFEAYVPKEKRVLGYFALPVLAGDRIVAALDLKTDRARRRLTIQRWTWTRDADPVADKPALDAALDRFAAFQLAEG